MVKVDVRKNIDGGIEIALHSVSNLFNNLLKTRAVLTTDKDVAMVLEPLGEVRGCIDHLDEIVKAIDKAINKTLPKRPKVPTGLKPIAADLRKFDGRYFDYTKEAYYKHKDTFQRICYGLATWVFDDGDTKAALHDVRKAFGDEVCLQVRKNLKNRHHDT